MHWFSECVPCFFRQILTVGRLLNLDEVRIKVLIREAGDLLSTVGDISPPEFAMQLYRKIYEWTGEEDPYREVKRESNRLALEMVPFIMERINASSDPIREAVLLSIAGNIVDFGVGGEINVLEMLNRIVKEEKRADRRFFQIEDFVLRLRNANRIMILGDNCGEVVFDKIMMEVIKKRWQDKKFIFVVRGGPILNDVTLADAVNVGIDAVSEILSSDVSAPGLILREASEKFLTEFYQADMVISKGQGNFESLSDVNREVFFLFMAKCDVVANLVGCPKGSILLLRGGRG